MLYKDEYLHQHTVLKGLLSAYCIVAALPMEARFYLIPAANL